MSSRKLMRYEKVRLLGQRANQLSKGAKPMTDITGLTDPLKIAEKEYKEGVIPISVIRFMPNKEIHQVDIIRKRNTIPG